MGYSEVTSLDADTTISIGGFNKKTKKDNPTSAEGYYLGSRVVETKTGESKLHFFQTAKGNLGVWGKTDMDRKLASVTPGTMTRVSFSRMQETPKGDMYVFKVEVDGSNTIDVADLSSQTSEDTGGEEEAYGDGDDNVGTDPDDEDVEQQAALAAAERQAKVAAMLSKGKVNRK